MSYFKNIMQSIDIVNHAFNRNYKYIQNLLSQFRTTKRCVPQGSILGELLLICYKGMSLVLQPISG